MSRKHYAKKNCIECRFLFNKLWLGRCWHCYQKYLKDRRNITNVRCAKCNTLLTFDEKDTFPICHSCDEK